MTVEGYVVGDDPRTLNKTIPSTPTKIFQNVRIKDEMSITHPVLDLGYASVLDTEAIFKINFIHIGNYGRFYRVRRFVTSENRIIVECDVDVLTSFSDDIKNVYAFVERQRLGNKKTNNDVTTLGNYMIIDDSLPQTAKHFLSVDKDHTLQYFDPLYDWNDSSNPPSYVMLINGGAVASNNNNG